MNKTAVTLAFVGLALVGFVGVVLIMLLRPDNTEAQASVIQLVSTVLGIATTGVVTFYALGKQGETIETIKTQTNGNTSALQSEVARLSTLLALSHPVDPAAATAALTDADAGRHVA